MELKHREETFELPPLNDLFNFPVIVELTFYNGKLSGIEARTDYGVPEDGKEIYDIDLQNPDDIDLLRYAMRQAERYEERYKKEKSF